MAEAAPDRPARPIGSALLGPVPLAAVALLLLNDQVLKAAYPGWLTGKLSDFAGLAFFPLFLQALWELWRPRPSRRALLVCVLATGAVFALVKTTGPGITAYRIGLAALQWPLLASFDLLRGQGAGALAPVQAVRDPSDLLALPMLGVAWAVGRRRLERAAHHE